MNSSEILKSQFTFFKILYKSIKRLFCNHSFTYWKVRMVTHDKHLKFLDGRESNRWRKCSKCGVKHELKENNLYSGSSGHRWRRTFLHLDENNRVIERYVYRLGHEPKSISRNNKIDEILNNK